MITPLFKKVKKNGTTLYVFPSVAEDKNYETQNDNFKMNISHFALVKFKDDIDNKIGIVPNGVFYGGVNGATLSEKIVESLRNYVANQEVVMHNMHINNNVPYYDQTEKNNVTERIFWKWAKKIGLIDFELATYKMSSGMAEDFYYATSNQYDNPNDPGGNTLFREYLWKERNTNKYGIDSITPQGSPSIVTLPWLTDSIYYKINDELVFTLYNDESKTITAKITNIDYGMTNSGKYTIDLDKGIIDEFINVWGENITEDDIYVQLNYEKFVKFMSEIHGVNNVQLSNKTYTEAYAYISHQQGETPYLLWHTKDDVNYKPNLVFPFLGSEKQAEIIGGENANNPILTNPDTYPGSIWAQFDNGGNEYETSIGNSVSKEDNYYGTQNVLSKDEASNLFNTRDFESSDIDGLSLDFDIYNYSKAQEFIHPIDSFKEFSSISFDEVAPDDFEYNAILWFYTIDDVGGNNVNSATNLYGIEFLDKIDDNKFTNITKLVTNGYQDGNSYTFSLDTNIDVESYDVIPEFDPNKIYSLFGMELYYEALTRITYMNDILNQITVNHNVLKTRLQELQGLIYTQESVDSINSKIQTLETMLNVYSTLQIGESDTIVPELDTSVSPALIRLNSVDKRYGDIFHYRTSDMFTEFENNNAKTEINVIEQVIPIRSGKDFMVVINNDDNSTSDYDTSKELDKLRITINSDLRHKQSLDILVVPTDSTDEIASNKTPINDKQLEIYMNYNDGTTTTKELIKTINLPVISYYDSPQINPEYIAKLTQIPSWHVEHTKYTIGSDINKRKFKFIVCEDLLAIDYVFDPNNNTFNLSNIIPKLEKEMRIYVDDFSVLANESYTNYNNISGQYRLVDDTKFEYSIVKDIEIDPTGLVHNGGTNSDGIYEIINNNSDVVGYINVITDNGTDAELYDFRFNKDFDLYAVDTVPSFINDNLTIQGSNSVIILDYKPYYSLNIEFDRNIVPGNMLSMFDYLDGLYNITLPTDIVTIDTRLKHMPKITFLNSLLISITRISDQIDVSFADFDDRYLVDIKRLDKR